MTIAETSGKPRAIVVEEVVPHAIEKVWHALTSADMIARWLMKNDFEPEVGRRFTMQATPVGDWSGRVDCEVLEMDPPNLLKYSWFGGSASESSRYILESTVTWTLEAVDGGTRVKLVHDGFVSPENDLGYEGMQRGWGTVFERISRVIEDDANASPSASLSTLFTGPTSA